MMSQAVCIMLIRQYGGITLQRVCRKHCIANTALILQIKSKNILRKIKQNSNQATVTRLSEVFRQQ